MKKFRRANVGESIERKILVSDSNAYALQEDCMLHVCHASSISFFASASLSRILFLLGRCLLDAHQLQVVLCEPSQAAGSYVTQSTSYTEIVC